MSTQKNIELDKWLTSDNSIIFDSYNIEIKNEEDKQNIERKLYDDIKLRLTEPKYEKLMLMDGQYPYSINTKVGGLKSLYLKYNSKLPKVEINRVICISFKSTERNNKQRYGFGIYDLDNQKLYYIFNKSGIYGENYPEYKSVDIPLNRYIMIIYSPDISRSFEVITIDEFVKNKGKYSKYSKKYIDDNEYNAFKTLKDYFEKNKLLPEKIVIDNTNIESYNRIQEDLKVTLNNFYINTFYHNNTRVRTNIFLFYDYELYDEIFLRLLLLHFNLNINQFNKIPPESYKFISNMDKPVIAPKPKNASEKISSTPNTPKTPDSVGMFFISGHSGRNIRKYFTKDGLITREPPRMSIFTNTCYYTIVKTGTNLANIHADLFNFGITGGTKSIGERNREELKSLAFNPNNTSTLLKEIENLERNIYANAFYEILRNDPDKRFKNYFIEIFNDIIFYLTYINNKKREIVFEDILEFMNKPVCDIVEYIIKDVCKVNLLLNQEDNVTSLKPYLTKLESYKKESNNNTIPFDPRIMRPKIGSYTMLIAPLYAYLDNKQEDYIKVFSKEYTYFNLFKTLNELHLRRYAGEDTIINYDIAAYDEDEKRIFGMFNAPYELSWNNDAPRPQGMSVTDYILRHNLLVNNIWKDNRDMNLETINRNFNESDLKHDKNIFILNACNGIYINSEPIRKEYLIDGKVLLLSKNMFPDRPPELIRARRDSVSHMKEKYLKYKSKYLKLKRELF